MQSVNKTRPIALLCSYSESIHEVFPLLALILQCSTPSSDVTFAYYQITYSNSIGQFQILTNQCRNCSSVGTGSVGTKANPSADGIMFFILPPVQILSLS